MKMKHHYLLTGMAQIRNTDNTTSWRENEEQQELLFLASGNAKWYSHFGDSLVVSDKTKYTDIIRSSNHIPWHLPTGIENFRAHRNLHVMFTAA